MGVKNKKEKGNSWEREIGRILSLWWTKGEDKNVFGRRDVGGFFAVKRLPEDFKPSGDIISLKEIGDPFVRYFSIEAKFYASEESLLFEVLFERKSQILKWWQQCEQDAIGVMRVPWLIVKFNNRVPFIVVSKIFFESITANYKTFSYNSLLEVKLNFESSLYKSLLFIKLDSFLNWCTAEVVRCLISGSTK